MQVTSQVVKRIEIKDQKKKKNSRKISNLVLGLTSRSKNVSAVLGN